MPAIAQVEPLTTARALQGPFDYLAPPGAAVGQLLVVPFGRREVTGVVVGLADSSAIAPDRLASARDVLPHTVPADLVALARWMAREYCSTFARALQLVLPPARVRSERTALWAERTLVKTFEAPSHARCTPPSWATESSPYSTNTRS